MPLYEYACEECHKSFTVLQKMSAEQFETHCPFCNSKKVKRQISSFSCGGGTGTGIPGGFSGFGGG
jgi:putative FmdB family regulatory protein